MKFKYAVGFFLVLYALILDVQVLQAQQNAGITLVPATIEELANPGDILIKTLTVTNNSDQDKEFFVYKRDITGVESGGVPIFSEERAEITGYEMSQWVEIPIDSLQIPSFESVDIVVTIRVPETATAGSHFGGIFVSAEPPKLREIGAGVGYEVASIISIRISGDISDFARIRSFSTDKLLYSEKNVHFLARVENQGNILIRPRGPISITSMFGTEPEVFTVNSALAGVFPGTMRDIEFTWNSKGFGFGRYEAILALVYDGGTGQKTIDASLVFWVFPAKLMFTVLGAFVAVIALGYVLTKYYITQAIIRAAGGRRIPPQKYRKQVGVSRFTFVFISVMGVLVVFLLLVLVFFA